MDIPRDLQHGYDLLEQDRVGEAETHFERFLQSHSSEDALRGRALTGLAMIRRRSKQWRSVLDLAIQSVRASGPELNASWNLLQEAAREVYPPAELIGGKCGICKSDLVCPPDIEISDVCCPHHEGGEIDWDSNGRPPAEAIIAAMGGLSIDLLNNLEEFYPFCGTADHKATLDAIIAYLVRFHSEHGVSTSDSIFGPGDFARRLLDTGLRDAIPDMIAKRIMPEGMTVFDYLDAIIDALTPHCQPTLDMAFDVIHCGAMKSTKGRERAAKLLGCERDMHSLLAAAIASRDEPFSLEESLETIKKSCA